MPGTPLTLRHPIGLALWTVVAGGVLLAVPSFNRLLIALAGFIAYLIASLVMVLVLPRWWHRLIVTLIASPLIMMALIGIAEMFQTKAIGEGALAFIGPLMISWVVLPAAVLIRVALCRTGVSPE